MLVAGLIVAAPGLAWGARRAAPAKAPPQASTKTQSTEQFVDGIAAVVNKSVITLSQLQAQTQSAQQQLASQKIAIPDAQTLRRQVLHRMIDTELEKQEAKRLGIHVSDEQLQHAIQSIAARNKISVELLRQEVEKSGVTWKDYQDEIRHDVLMDGLRHRAVDSTIDITDADVDAYLKTHDGQSTLLPGSAPGQEGAQAQPQSASQAQPSGPVMLGLSDILVAVPENASSSQVQALRLKAQVILGKLRGGADFAAVAAASSDGPQALSGGSLGVRPVDGWPDLFITATAKLKPGQISGILQSGNGFHILKVVSRSSQGQAPSRPSSQPPAAAGAPGGPDQSGQEIDQGPKMVTQTHARHILIKVTKVTSDEQAKTILLRLRERIENGEDFATLAKRYSQDATAPQGGDLGWLNPGETVPAFEQAMDALQPGQISQPVKTHFGWHLIEVLGRRTKDMAEEYKRIQARRILYQRRAGPAFDDWLSQLRGKAYIDNRLEPKSDQGD